MKQRLILFVPYIKMIGTALKILSVISFLIICYILLNQESYSLHSSNTFIDSYAFIALSLVGLFNIVSIFLKISNVLYLLFTFPFSGSISLLGLKLLNLEIFKTDNFMIKSYLTLTRNWSADEKLSYLNNFLLKNKLFLSAVEKENIINNTTSMSSLNTKLLDLSALRSKNNISDERIKILEGRYAELLDKLNNFKIHNPESEIRIIDKNSISSVSSEIDSFIWSNVGSFSNLSYLLIGGSTIVILSTLYYLVDWANAVSKFIDITTQLSTNTYNLFGKLLTFNKETKKLADSTVNAITLIDDKTQIYENKFNSVSVSLDATKINMDLLNQALKSNEGKVSLIEESTKLLNNNFQLLGSETKTIASHINIITEVVNNSANKLTLVEENAKILSSSFQLLNEETKVISTNFNNFTEGMLALQRVVVSVLDDDNILRIENVNMSNPEVLNSIKEIINLAVEIGKSEEGKKILKELLEIVK